jgi:hypothetical protein
MIRKSSFLEKQNLNRGKLHYRRMLFVPPGHSIMIFEQKKNPKSTRNAVLPMQVESREARHLVDLLNGGTVVVRLRRRTASTRHAAGRTTLLGVDLSHDGVGNAFEGLLLGFVLKSS